MKEETPDTELFKAIFESSVEGILVVARDGTIQRANAAGEAMFGYLQGELIGKKVEALVPQDFRKNHTSHRAEYSQKPKARPMGKDLDLWGLRKDRSQFPLKISLSPIDIDGQPFVVAFVMDISERKKSERISNESDRKLSALIGNLQGIVYRCLNDRDYTMQFINEACEFITGYSRQEFLVGEVHFGKIIVPDDRDRVWNNTQKAVAEKRPFDLTYRIRDKKGNIKYLRATGGGVFNKTGDLVALEGFVADITALKNTEEELRGHVAKNKALLEALPDLMFINDFDGNYLELYPSEREKLQIRKEDVIGKNMKDILPVDVHSMYKKVFKKVKGTRKPQLLEYTLDERDGPKTYEGRTVPLNEHAFLTIVRDISERKEVEKTLFIRNRALASAGNGIVIADAKIGDYPIIFANAAFCNTSGYDSDEVLGRNCRFLQNDDRDQEAIMIMEKALQNGEPCQVELRNYRKDGTLFWNELTITPIYNDQAELTHFIGVQNDVTDRKNEELLKDGIRNILEKIANEEPLIVIANTIVEMVEMHLKGCIASIQLLDAERESLHKLAAPNLPKTFDEVLEGAKISENVGSSGTAAFLKKEVVVNNIATDPRWADYKKLALKYGLKSCWAFPIFSSRKEVFGTLSLYFDHKRKPQKKERDVVADITDLASVAIEQHRINIELEQSKKQLKEHSQNLEEIVMERTDELKLTVKKLVETNLCLEDQVTETKAAEQRTRQSKILVASIAKNFPNGIIVVFNENMELVMIDGQELLEIGFKKTDLEGKGIDTISVLSKKRKDIIKANIQKTFEGQHLSFEVDYGKKIYAVSSVPLFVDRKITWALFVYTNISEQKQAERVMKVALEKEQELNVLKSRFISMASHEFRTPLSAINTSAILIAKQNMPGKEEKRKKYIEQIQSNVRNLVGILNDFLSLGKLEEGKVQAKPEQFDLIGFTNDLIREIEPNRKRGQKIALLSQEEPVFAYLDPKLLQHVVSNLLSNAIKYSDEGDLITIQLKSKKDKVSVQVKDQGIGIPVEEQAHLFGRFFRAENSTNIEGTGLGLNIVKQYTELMGGTVGFESEVGKGTTFWVEFKK